MLISIQFPLADSRAFVSNSGRLRKPGWPLPTPDREFVRSYGAIRIRPQGGLAGWLGENEICEAARSVRLSKSLTLNTIAPPTTLSLRVAFRRFFFDGLAASKFELGLVTPSRKSLTVTRRDLKNFLDRFLNLTVRIPDCSGICVESPLVRSGEYLAHSYLSATTRVGYTDKLESWYIRAGLPLLFLGCSCHEKTQLPYYTRKVALPDHCDFELHHCLVPYEGGKVRMWFLDEHDNEDTDFDSRGAGAARRLRIYLQRLNAEHECLRLVLRNIISKGFTVAPRSDESNALQCYFNEATRRIGILEAKSCDQFDEEICEIARDSLSAMNPGQLDALNQVLSTIDLRKNIRRKLDEYVNRWGGVTIIQHAEEINMGDVFKDISQSIITTRGSIAQGVINLRHSGNEDIADAIAQLDELIASVGDKALEPKKKEECADLLKSITEESNKQQPNKNVLRALGNSLLSIVTQVEPLAKAVSVAFDVLKSLWS